MRYIRQLGLIGSQKRLAKKRVAVIGLGGLGSTVSQMLCRAGVGTIHLYDFDKVSISDLHRQILYHEGDVGIKKSILAKKKLLKMNSKTKVFSHDLKIDAKTIKSLPETDLILDCTDNITVRKVINMHCIRRRLPWVHGTVDDEAGMVAVFVPGKACYECLMHGKKDSSRKQILGTYPVVVGGLQATMALNKLLGKTNDALFIGFNDFHLKKIKIKKMKECRACSNRTHL